MEAFVCERGLVAPLLRAGIDTDQIMPRQFLKGIERQGFGRHLFDAWRYRDTGWLDKPQDEREPDPDFALNRPEYQGARFLLAGPDFGCGSSREHAVWGLQEYGFRAVLAPSFADIFRENALRNGLLTVQLAQDDHQALAQAAQAQPLDIEVDLGGCAVRLPDGREFAFALDPKLRAMLMEGLDDIGLSLRHADSVRAWEEADRGRRPWLYSRLG